MHTLIEKLQEELAFQLSASSNRRVVVGVSGGADSVALLRALHFLQDQLQLELYVAHFDHHTRAGQSAEERKWVEELVKQIQLPVRIGKIDIDGDFSEEAMRQFRLDFLIETAQEFQAAYICLAHHADDQAETVLHHLIRGTGLQGMTGIPARRVLSEHLTLLHPMLAVRKSAILNYLESISQEFCVDSSNRDLRYTRNLIRHQLIPLLNKLNPQSVAHVLQLSHQASEACDYIQGCVQKLFESSVISIDREMVRLDAGVLRDAPVMMTRELFRLVWEEQKWPRKKMTFTHWGNLARFVREDQVRIDFPAGIIARKRGEMLTLERRLREH